MHFLRRPEHLRLEGQLGFGWTFPGAMAQRRDNRRRILGHDGNYTANPSYGATSPPQQSGNANSGAGATLFQRQLRVAKSWYVLNISNRQEAGWFATILDSVSAHGPAITHTFYQMAVGAGTMLSIGG